MGAQPEERARQTGISAAGRNAREESALLRPGEATDGNRDRVEDRELGIAVYLRDERLPAPPFHGPEIRRLPQKRRPVLCTERRAERGMVLPEIAIDAPVGLVAEELAGKFHREHLTVRQARGRATVAQARAMPQVVQGVVGHAVDRDEERLEVKGMLGVPGRLRLKRLRCWHTLSAAALLPWTSCLTQLHPNLHTALATR